LHAQIIKKDGKKEFVVLPCEEFLKVQEQLQDFEDLRCLREAKEAEKDAATIGIDELRRIGVRQRHSGQLKKKAIP